MTAPDDAFPFLRALPPALRDAFAREARPLSLPAGAALCREGDACAVLPMVVAGEARVSRTSPGGRRLTLYRIAPGEACILTASCLLSARPFPADAETVTAVEALAVPAATFRAWHDAAAPWRSFVAELMARRFAEVVELVEAVAFQRVDARLAALLAAEGPVLARTHEALADELGTAREVVSRLLKEWEREGVVALARGRVEVVGPAALARLAQG